jgi:hypothetical protein
MNQHQPHTAEEALEPMRAPTRLTLEQGFAWALNEMARLQSEEHGRLTREGIARAKARREAEARAQAAAADQASE